MVRYDGFIVFSIVVFSIVMMAGGCTRSQQQAALADGQEPVTNEPNLRDIPATSPSGAAFTWEREKQRRNAPTAPTPTPAWQPPPKLGQFTSDMLAAKIPADEKARILKEYYRGNGIILRTDEEREAGKRAKEEAAQSSPLSKEEKLEQLYARLESEGVKITGLPPEAAAIMVEGMDLLSAAKYLYDQGFEDHALRYAEQALTENSNSFDALLLKSRLLPPGWETEKEVGYRQLVKMNPNSVDSLVGLADVLIRKNPSEGIFYVQKALQLDSSNALAYLILGMGYERLGRYEDALVALQKSYQIGQGSYTMAHILRIQEGNPIFSPIKLEAPEPANVSLLSFTPVTEQAGIRFRHINGATGEKYLPETMGAGVAFLDYDSDGYLDLYFVNGAPLPGWQGDEVPTNRLFRNNGDGTFTDRTEQAGVGDMGYGLGCCMGDFDNDGHPDIYVTNFGPNVLYHNNGDGSFTDITIQAGIGHPGFSAGCAFADYDQDGDLDLFVVNYVILDLAHRPICSQKGIRAYCRPEEYPPATDVLYRNNGDGTFTDVSAEAGITKLGRGLGVVWGDIDNDGDQDVFVANDRMENFLYENQGDGTFVEVGEFLGVALNEHGYAESGMGVAFGDTNSDGFLDLIVTNYQTQTNTLYESDGAGGFWDVTSMARLSEATLIPMSWGTGLVDFDNDGRLDIFFANGHLEDAIETFESVGSYRQPNQFFRNMGDGTFGDMTRSCGPGCEIVKSSRGAAFGDYDNDGDTDILIGNINETPDLLRNDHVGKEHWLGIKLVGTRSNRDGIGARITIITEGKRQMREIQSGGSYLSQNDLRALFGIGNAKQVETITVRWPDGSMDQHRGVAADQWITLYEGIAGSH